MSICIFWKWNLYGALHNTTKSYNAKRVYNLKKNKYYLNVSFLLDLFLKYTCNMTERQHPIDVQFIDVYSITYNGVWLVLMQKEIFDTQNDANGMYIVFWKRKQDWNTSQHLIDTIPLLLCKRNNIEIYIMCCVKSKCKKNVEKGIRVSLHTSNSLCNRSTVSASWIILLNLIRWFIYSFI